MYEFCSNNVFTKEDFDLVCLFLFSLRFDT